ncbi:MAG: phytoene desaturase family protein [Hyphomicrobiales bacterium]
MLSYDAIIIGAGHNGLTCAGFLAKKGRKVLVLEAEDAPGGAARTMELAKGFKVSPVAHLLTHLHPKVIAELGLKKHGLELAAANMPTTALSPDGNHLILHGPFAGRIEGDIEVREQLAWLKLREKLLKFSNVLAPAMAQTPPRLKGGGIAGQRDLGALGLRVRQLGRDEMREFLRMILVNVADTLEDELSDERLMGAIAFDAVLGTHFGPRSPNSLMALYYRLAGTIEGQQGAIALPVGGMGTVIQALTNACAGLGVTVRTGTPVKQVVVEDCTAKGVVCADGEEHLAPLVVSAINPRTTVLNLVGASEFDTGFVRKISNVRMRGNAAKLHLALKSLPAFTGVSEAELGGRLVIAPSIDYVERAFNPAKYGACSAEPVMEITIPSLRDKSLVQGDGHVLSAIVQYAPYELREGWRDGKAAFLKTVMATLEQYAPGIGKLAKTKELLTPLDIEKKFHMTGGHWHHGELAVDQMFMLRPVPAAAQYETPLEGLWLCGAGSHPGGNVMGAAGMNAASRILKRRA